MAQLSRPIRRELAALRRQWRMWKAGGPHPAYSLTCPTRCGDCEACGATAYRADRCAEIASQAAGVAAQHP